MKGFQKNGESPREILLSGAVFWIFVDFLELDGILIEDWDM